MKIFKQLTLVAALLAVSVSGANATTYNKSIVLDMRGNAVTTVQGECVTHDWPRANSICNAQVANIDIPNIVYFDFAKYTLNAKGKQVVDQVAAGLKSINGPYSVSLAGHTDRVDTVAFNQKLSERRAGTVKTALVQRGIPGSKISTIGYGETRNAVPTADGVPEQLNRRVEIEVNR